MIKIDEDAKTMSLEEFAEKTGIKIEVINMDDKEIEKDIKAFEKGINNCLGSPDSYGIEKDELWFLMGGFGCKYHVTLENRWHGTVQYMGFYNQLLEIFEEKILRNMKANPDLSYKFIKDTLMSETEKSEPFKLLEEDK